MSKGQSTAKVDRVALIARLRYHAKIARQAALDQRGQGGLGEMLDREARDWSEAADLLENDQGNDGSRAVPRRHDDKKLYNQPAGEIMPCEHVVRNTEGGVLLQK